MTDIVVHEVVRELAERGRWVIDASTDGRLRMVSSDQETVREVVEADGGYLLQETQRADGPMPLVWSVRLADVERHLVLRLAASLRDAEGLPRLRKVAGPDLADGAELRPAEPGEPSIAVWLRWSDADGPHEVWFSRNFSATTFSRSLPFGPEQLRDLMLSPDPRPVYTAGPDEPQKRWYQR